MKLIDEIAKAIGVKKTQAMLDLILDLEWEADRMSESGQETYEKLLKKLGVELHENYKSTVRF